MARPIKGKKADPQVEPEAAPQVPATPGADLRTADLMRMFGLTSRRQISDWADAGLLGEVRREDVFGNSERVYNQENVNRLKWMLKLREKRVGPECMKYLIEYATTGHIQYIDDLRLEMEN